MRIVFIGAGRLATNLAPALHRAGHEILQVYSRTMESALALGNKVGAAATSDLQEVSAMADCYIFSVSDKVLPQLITQLGRDREQALFVHTAGSVSLSVFQNCVSRYGVLYPMQTFSKERRVDFTEIPVFIEGNDDKTLEEIRALAASVSRNVTVLSSESRRHIHLAAVFACNFANHCYALSADILKEHGVDFSVMLPLIDETARKVHELAPADAQTGPAVRFDENVIAAQTKLLENLPRHAQIYELMSKSIHEKSLEQI